MHMYIFTHGLSCVALYIHSINHNYVYIFMITYVCVYIYTHGVSRVTLYLHSINHHYAYII